MASVSREQFYTALSQASASPVTTTGLRRGLDFEQLGQLAKYFDQFGASNDPRYRFIYSKLSNWAKTSTFHQIANRPRGAGTPAWQTNLVVQFRNGNRYPLLDDGDLTSPDDLVAFAVLFSLAYGLSPGKECCHYLISFDLAKFHAASQQAFVGAPPRVQIRPQHPNQGQTSTNQAPGGSLGLFLPALLSAIVNLPGDRRPPFTLSVDAEGNLLLVSLLPPPAYLTPQHDIDDTRRALDDLDTSTLDKLSADDLCKIARWIVQLLVSERNSRANFILRDGSTIQPGNLLLLQLLQRLRELIATKQGERKDCLLGVDTRRNVQVPFYRDDIPTADFSVDQLVNTMVEVLCRLANADGVAFTSLIWLFADLAILLDPNLSANPSATGHTRPRMMPPTLEQLYRMAIQLERAIQRLQDYRPILQDFRRKLIEAVNLHRNTTLPRQIRDFLLTSPGCEPELFYNFVRGYYQVQGLPARPLPLN